MKNVFLCLVFFCVSFGFTQTQINVNGMPGFFSRYLGGYGPDSILKVPIRTNFNPLFPLIPYVGRMQVYSVDSGFYYHNGSVWKKLFITPTGTTSQYVTGNGSLATFPPIPAISGATGVFGRTTVTNGLVTSGKKVETYSGTTNASGLYTITFPVAYSATPNIQANLINGTDPQNLRITSITTTGFTVLIRTRVDVIGLLPTWNNVSGALVNVLIIEF